MFVTRPQSAVQDHRARSRSAPYLTDGVRLFRVLDTIHDARDRPLRALEDCHSFEVELVDADAFERRELRPVRGR
jgi:hypothetical protein